MKVIFGIMIVFFFNVLVVWSLVSPSITYATTGEEQKLLIDTPGTVIGALKETHDLSIKVGEKVYKAKTPLWISNLSSNSQHVVFDARRPDDDKLVRVYVLKDPMVVIEEEIQEVK